MNGKIHTMILVYTHKITPRLRYIFKQLFSRIINIPVDFTTKIEDFVAYNGVKISYTKVPLGKEFFIQSHELLFQQGIKDVDLSMSSWEGLPCFFKTSDKSEIPFDVFAASFYLVSRYEEYVPHIKDKHGRFNPEESLAFKNGFLEEPLVDIWALKFLEVLKTKYPDLEQGKKEYTFISTLDIDNAFAFKHKSVIRNVGGFFKDLYQFKLLNVWYRFAVLTNLKKDPYDVFDKIINYKKELNIDTLFFFLIGDYTTYDTNISLSKTKFKLLIKDMVDYARVGLHPSYYTMKDEVLLKKEKERLEGVINMPVTRSRQHFLRISFPETYQKLIDLEVTEDYTMGYAAYAGFRASTCTPFYFYDLDFEIQTPLKIFPFAVMDTTLNDYLKLTPKQSLGKIRDLKNEVRKVKGTFVTLFHNESLSNYGRWKGWQRVYGSMLKIAKN